MFDWILRFAQDDEKEALDDEEKELRMTRATGGGRFVWYLETRVAMAGFVGKNVL